MLTWLEISKKAIEYNLKQFRKLIGKNVLLMPVIKANAYGHGFFEVAKICNENIEVDRICVVCDDEASQLCAKGIKKAIMILSFYELSEKKLLKLAENNVIFPLYDEKQAKSLNRVGERVKKKIKVHLKIDTGASRIGILPKDATDFAQKILRHKNLTTEGVFSHFSSSEESQSETIRQLNAFKETANKIETLLDINIPIKHISCSAATVLYPTSRLDAVRVGLNLYGLHSTNETKRHINLKPALTWRTKIIQVRNVPSGTKIGYGGTYQVSRPTKIATVPVGYWDGYDRKFSNKAQVIIKAAKCPIIGRVCMNLSMVDVTAIKENVKIGDAVILIGKDKNSGAEITADELAKLTGTINYEIVDRINPLLPRITI